ncbi:MAG: hypothetical protein V7696_16400 [Halioglobus sp.]
MANDLQPTGALVISGPSACTVGETISATVRVLFEDGGGANERYSVGFFVGENGEPAIGGASCTFDSLQPIGTPTDLTSGTGPFAELNGDACGDISKSDPTYKDLQLDQILCADEDGDGNVDLSYILTWVNNGNQENCTDPLDPLQFRPNPPKCLSDLEADLPIKVEDPPSIDVGKGAAPSQLFAPGGQVVFPITIINTSPSSSDPVEIYQIVDVPYGDITNQTSCTLPLVLAPQQSVTCNYTREITGSAGESFPDTVTVTGRDDEGNIVSESDDALVTIIADNGVPLPGDLRLVKFASPGKINEPGGTVQYDVLFANVSTTPVELTSAFDDLYGDLNGKGSCSFPQTLSGASSVYFCAFQEEVIGQPGDIITDTITAQGFDNTLLGTTLLASDTASVEILNLSSDIEVTKVASPSTVSEPGGNVDFGVGIQNTSAVDTVTINRLFDSQLGIPKGDCIFPQVLAPGARYSCTYSGLVTGNAGDIVTNVVDAFGFDDDGRLVNDFDAASVDVVGADPSIKVAKVAIPTFALAGGSDVRFVVGVENTSSTADPVTITSLVDVPFGDLDGRGTCALPPGGLVLQPAPDPDSFYICSFVQNFSGTAGQQFVDTVTASGVDDEGTPVSGLDDATVSIVNVELPEALLDLRKIASPVELPEPGGDVTYTVILSNVSDPNNPNLVLTVNSLVDDIYGDLNGLGDCVTPVDIPLSDFVVCRFTEAVSGQPGDTVTDRIDASATSLNGLLTATAFDEATVTIVDIPSSISVTKTANPISVDEPGAEVTFQIVVVNTSQADTVTLESLIDNVHGDLNGQGTCRMPQQLFLGRDPYRCDFTVFVGGSAGDQETNTVTALGTDDDGLEVEDTDQADVAILGISPTITALKVANPGTVSVEGGSVTFSFTTTNTSQADTVTLDTLIDSVFGDLDGQGSCSVPQTLAPGESYTCEFQETLAGALGETHLDEIEVTGTSEDGDLVSARAVAIVDFIAAIRSIPVLGQFGLLALTILIVLLGVRAAKRRK